MRSSASSMGSAPKKVDLKIILLGPPMAGKTCFLARYVRDEFGKTDATVGASFALKVWGGHKFGIWDTAGQEKYDSLSNFYCRNAGAVILLYDITDRSSFSDLPRFVEKLRECDPNAIVVVVGTKLDLVLEHRHMRKVEFEEGEAFAKSINAAFFESSSKANIAVSEVFDHIGHTFNARRAQPGASPFSTPVPRHSTVELSAPTPSRGPCAC